MPSFYDKAKKVIDKSQDMLTVLEELDRTGKFRKRAYKKKVDFTIDEDTFIKFRNYCKKNSLNMSALVEKCMKEEIGR